MMKAGFFMALFGALLALIPEEKALWLDSLYKSSSLKKDVHALHLRIPY
jgi:hypothetical protein